MLFTMSTLPKPFPLRWPAVPFYNKLSSYQCRALHFIACSLEVAADLRWSHFLVRSHTLHLRIIRLTNSSYLSDRIHYLGLRYRGSSQGLQTRPIRPTRQVEHDNLYRRCIVHASSLLDADCCLAVSEHLLWRAYLVPHAVRSSDADLSFNSCFSAAHGSRYDQYSADENAGPGP